MERPEDARQSLPAAGGAEGPNGFRRLPGRGLGRPLAGIGLQRGQLPGGLQRRRGHVHGAEAVEAPAPQPASPGPHGKDRRRATGRRRAADPAGQAPRRTAGCAAPLRAPGCARSRKRRGKSFRVDRAPGTPCAGAPGSEGIAGPAEKRGRRFADCAEVQGAGGRRRGIRYPQSTGRLVDDLAGRRYRKLRFPRRHQHPGWDHGGCGRHRRDGGIPAVLRSAGRAGGSPAGRRAARLCGAAVRGIRGRREDTGVQSPRQVPPGSGPAFAGCRSPGGERPADRTPAGRPG